MAEPILNEARAEQNLVETNVDGNVKYELSEELLKELSSNTYREGGRYGSFSTLHDDLPSLTFWESKKMVDERGRWKINTWEELVNKFFSKFYPLSCASNYDKMYVDDEEGLDPLEFITWRNSKSEDHKKVDENWSRESWIRNENHRDRITKLGHHEAKFLKKYCPPESNAEKMEEINNFQQEPDESLF
ncbi:hypothetical protein Tco_1123009 [Tanacetum coccineum]|uniref:Uncharacterized protein n=1 Tax=Tanacetum coccineum TaxID=301880 RepID=A0ABQ5J249_9ASTR